MDSVSALVKALSDQLAGSRTAVAKKEEVFIVLLSAAMTKAREFAIAIHAGVEESNPYFVTATIRGICEDLIALTFVRSVLEPDRSEWLLAWNMNNVCRSIGAQTAFFGAERPFQPILTHTNLKGLRADAEADLSAKKSQHGWTYHGDTPSTHWMARQVGLGDLYSFLYHGASEWVHFSPRLLMRMGWGEEKTVGAMFNFSTKHFSNYYREFNRTYSAYLLCRFVQTFAGDLELTQATELSLELSASLADQLTWPELVTYEEMNVRPPDLATRSFMQTAYRMHLDREGRS